MELAKFIDHTYLQPDAQKKDIDKILAEAKQYHFASVCISPIWVSYAHKELAGSGVNVVTVIGFPEGATPTSVKAFETKQAIADGADEVDMVIPIGFLKDAEKGKACELAKKAGADFVKTSTGFSKWGATVEDVKLMRKTVGPDMGVKASGGVRDRKEAEAMVAAGANRIGTSHGVEIMQG